MTPDEKVLKLAELERDLATARAYIDDYEKVVQDAENEIDDWQDEVDRLQNAIDELEELQEQEES